MFGIAAIVMFGIALILDVATLGSGHWTPGTFTTAGLLCLAIHLTLAVRPTWLQRGNPPQ